MAYVITNKCLDEQYGQCVDVCPVDCIHPGLYKNKRFMVIDPTRCINCDACLSVCPIGAIVASEKEDPKYAKINKKLAHTFKNHGPITPKHPNTKPNRPENKLIYKKNPPNNPIKDHK